MWLAKVISIIWAERWIMRGCTDAYSMRYTHTVWKCLSECQIWLLSFLTNVSFLFLPSLPLFFSTEWSHLLLCGPFVPLVLFKDKMSDYFSFSRCPFVCFTSPFVSALCTVSSPSEDHFIPNPHMYYNINNIQIAQSYITKDKATNRFSFERCFRFAWCIW